MNMVIDRKFIEFATQEIRNNIRKFSNTELNHYEVDMLAEEIISKIDWNNPALMHKGFGRLTKNYLEQIEQVQIRF